MSSYPQSDTRSRPRYSPAACTSGLKRLRSSSISFGSAGFWGVVHGAPPPRSHGGRAQTLGQRRVGGARQAPRAGLVFARPAHFRGDAVQQARAHRLAPGACRPGPRGWSGSTSRKRSTVRSGGLVVGAELLVDQHQHLLGREVVVEAAQLIGVAHVFGVHQRGRVVRAARDAPPAAAFGLEREGLGEVALALDPAGDHLQVEGAQEAGGLAQDRDDLRPGDDLGDRRRGRARAQVLPARPRRRPVRARRRRTGRRTARASGADPGAAQRARVERRSVAK